jgi:hypothetical protein
MKMRDIDKIVMVAGWYGAKVEINEPSAPYMLWEIRVVSIVDTTSEEAVIMYLRKHPNIGDSLIDRIIDGKFDDYIDKATTTKENV